MGTLLREHGTLIGLLFVLGIPALAVGLLFLVRRVSTRKSYEPPNSVVAACLGCVGALYAITSVFAMFHGLEAYAQLRQDFRKEAFSVGSIAANSSVMGEAAGDDVRDAVLTYSRTIRDEWPRTVRGEFSTAVEDARSRLVDTLAALRPETELQRAYVDQALQTVEAATAGQEHQLFIARQGHLEGLAWVTIALLAGVVLFTCCLFRLPERRLHALVVALIGVVIGANLFLLLELSYPMTGTLAIEPTATPR